MRKTLLAATLALMLTIAFAAISQGAQNCPPNCIGGPGSDTINGNGNNNTIEGRGSDDLLDGRGGTDNVKGEGGAGDFVYVGVGNSDRGAGGPGMEDGVIVWGDSGSDYASGGQHLGDNCYIDFPADTFDADSCEWVWTY